MNNEILLLLIPLVVVFLIPLGTVISKGFGRYLSMGSYLAGGLYGVYLMPSILLKSRNIIIGNWLPPFGINLFLSPFSLGIVILIFFAAFLVMFKDIHNEGKDGRYYLLYTLFILASIGMVLTGDLFNLFVFLEISGIASFSLIAAGKTIYSPGGSLKYLIQAQIASLAMLAGIALIYSASGVLNIAVLAKFAAFNPAFAFLSIFLVLFPFMLELKLFPFNTWVGGAYLGADYTVAASISGIGTAAGTAVVLRILFTLVNPQSAFSAIVENTRILLIAAGSLTVIIGELSAFTEKNLKKVFAYSSVGHMGILAVGIGIASKDALTGVLFILINHTASKMLLFSITEVFSKVSGTNDWKGMKGIGRSYPLAAGLFIVGAMALFGIPLFAGFWGKFFILRTAFELGGIAAAGAAAILIGTIFEGVYFMKISHTFFEEGGSIHKKKHRPFFGIQALILAGVTISVGLIPSLISTWTGISVQEFLNPVSTYIQIILNSGGAM